MRNGARMGGRGAAVLEDDFDARGRRLAVLQALGWSHRDAVGFAVAAFATVAILVNVLFLQTGAHPAPMVTSSVAMTAPVQLASASVGDVPAIPRQRPVEAAPAAPVQPQPQPQAQPQPKAQPPATTRPQAAVVTDIQRELARRGFYDGTVDGRYGPKTDAAIRDFEQSVGLRPSTAPDEALLRAIVRSPVTVRQQQPARRSSAPASGPTPPARIDPIAEMLTPSKRVVAVQRALTEFGYGQIEPSGLVDPETQVAIEKFERQRKLPITGQVSERVVRELAGITGRPIE